MQINPDWLHDKDLQTILRTLSRCFHTYLVGGCVRDAVLGLPVSDIDIATEITPDGVKEILEGVEGVTLYPTGVDHGTWTVAYGNSTFEITTFRKDVATDGRRATVAFSDDIDDDAQRRDFTMNALYMNHHGKVIDPTGQGISDLLSRRVRFIGDAEERCREDYLRILRLFRFHAKYGKGPLDATAFWAARNCRDGLKQVSGERIWSELKKTLECHDPVEALIEMERAGVLELVLPEHGNVMNVADVCYVERSGSLGPSWVRRYVALMGYAPHTMRLPHSNKEEAHVAQALQFSYRSAAHAAFVLKDSTRAFDSQVLRMARERSAYTDPWADIYLGMSVELPVCAQDYMDRGVKPGPVLGKKLKQAKEFFVRSGLRASKQQLLMKTGVARGYFD